MGQYSTAYTQVNNTNLDYVATCNYVNNMIVNSNGILDNNNLWTGSNTFNNTVYIGSDTINSTINTNTTSKITTFANSQTGGGYTFNVIGSPLTTICNMLATGFYIYNTLDMTNYGITEVASITFTSGGSQTTPWNTNLLTPYAPLASPILTGNPTAPTPLATDNDTTIATTQYVTRAISNIPAVTGYALLNNASLQTFTGPITLSGTTNGITQPANTNNTTLATTAFVTNIAPISTTSIMSSIYSTDVYFVSGTTQVSIQSGNFVQFNSLPFQINITTALSTSTLIAITFNINPWPLYPSSVTGTITGLCINNSVNYSFNYSWSGGILITIPSGSSAPKSAGYIYTFNFASLGIFSA
jgi:hypothetical protein